MEKDNEFQKRQIIIDSGLKDSALSILKLESQTIVHCKLKACEIFQQGGWANINPNTYLINRQSNERLKLLFAENIPQTPHRHFFRTPGDCLSFTLIFQKIPETGKAFCLYEETPHGEGFFVGEIPKNKSGIYRIRIN
jgi:hypothetical protein